MSRKVQKRNETRTGKAKQLLSRGFDSFSSILRDYNFYLKHPEYSSYGDKRVRKYIFHLKSVPEEILEKNIIELTRWEAEYLDELDSLIELKKYTEKGSLKGHKRKKWLRKKYNKQRRQLGKRYEHHLIHDRQDYADSKFDHSYRGSYAWDIW